MYEPFRDGQVRLSVDIYWDKNTARGFMGAMAVVLLLLIALIWVEPPKWSQPEMFKFENTIPIEFFLYKQLSFGEGDGTGGSKGNLTREGAAHKGDYPEDQFANAKIKAPSGDEAKTLDENATVASNMVPASNLSSGDTKDGGTGTSDRNVGSPNGTESGTGLGDKGDGAGAGTGLGKINWGGGGSRIVTSKPKNPVYPENVDIKYAVVKVRFWVDPSGSVIKAVPVDKVDPRLEAVATRYVKKYRFNPLDSDVIMEGMISITFKKS